MNIILASSSPRRRDLLTQAGIDFSVMTVDIDEAIYPDESPQDYIQRMVSSKAHAAISTLLTNPCKFTTKQSASHCAYLLLTADTIGILPNEDLSPTQKLLTTNILVKPKSREHAYAMWQQMSGRSHQVCTAVQASLLLMPTCTDSMPTKLSKTPDKLPYLLWQQQIFESTEVTFIELTLAQMQQYWQTDEPHDKAGGYAIQGRGAAWVSRINGSYTNVVGLPLAQTVALIQKASNQLNLSA